MKSIRPVASLLVLVIGLFMAVACGPHCSLPTDVAAPGNGSAVSAGSSSAAVPAPGTCHISNRNNQLLPDHGCTPGTTNPDVRQDNLNSTICKTGWTKTVRPPVSVTIKLKKQIDQAYGLSTSTQGELDHLISLELGGAPSDPRNLWVEPGPIPNPKDEVENQLHEAVCAGLISLQVGQQNIAVAWTTAIDVSGLSVTGGRVCLRNNPSRCAASRHGLGE